MILPLPLSALLIFIFGTAIGSFLNVVIWRLPRHEPLTGRSRCPHCSAQLRARDLVPLASYLILRGRCRSCSKPILPRYFFIEFITGLLFALVWLHINPQHPADYLLLARNLFIVNILIATFVIDQEHFLILDKIVFPGWAAVIVFNIFLDILYGQNLLSIHSFALGGLGAGAILAGIFFLFWYLSQGTWMGLGDSKLSLLLGGIVGWPYIVVTAFLAFGLGAIISVFWLAAGTKHLKTAVPFGTFLVAAALITMFYGPQLWVRYLHLLGL